MSKYKLLSIDEKLALYDEYNAAAYGTKPQKLKEMAEREGLKTFTLKKWLGRIKKTLMDKPSEEEYLFLKGKSDYGEYDEDGKLKVTRGWQKFDTDTQKRYDAIKKAIVRLAEGLPQKAPIVLVDTNTEDDLLVKYNIGDAHLGLYAWDREAGANYSLELGIDMLNNAVSYLIGVTPQASTAIIQNLGDFYHSDSKSEETRSGNKLDVDGRWAKVMEAGIATMTAMIEVALTKHTKVVYIGCRGNHDDHTSMMLAMCLKSQFKDNPRVEIKDSVPMFHYYQFGTNMLCSTHGHTAKPDRLPLIAAVDQPQMWADTTNRHWSIGHIHHKTVQEFPGITVSSYNTMAAQDSWHSESGYRSNRTMTATIYHKHNGTVGTNEVNPSMLMDTRLVENEDGE